VGELQYGQFLPDAVQLLSLDENFLKKIMSNIVKEVTMLLFPVKTE
jgi:hypothetical protein